MVLVSGFKMYAVGVGNAVEDELREIASDPTGEHYFYTADFKAMTQIAKKLQINICQGPTHTLPHTYTPSHTHSLTHTPRAGPSYRRHRQPPRAA